MKEKLKMILIFLVEFRNKKITFNLDKFMISFCVEFKGFKLESKVPENLEVNTDTHPSKISINKVKNFPEPDRKKITAISGPFEYFEEPE